MTRTKILLATTLILLHPLRLTLAQECTPGARPMLPDRRYALLNDVLVQDKVTKLVWTRCLVGEHFEDGICKGPKRNQVNSWFDWSAANAEVMRWNKLDEKMKWRLPTIDELSTLVERTCKAPAINTHLFPGMSAWTFWSTTPFSINGDYQWVIDLSNGDIYTDLKESAFHNLLLVRGRTLRLDKEDSQPKKKIDRLAPWRDGIHDLDNSSLAKLQPFAEAAGQLPKDSGGQTDYVSALKEGLINPRSSVEGSAPMKIYPKPVFFKNTAQMPWVKFPHKVHSEWLACENCHDRIFAKKKVASKLSMERLYEGEACGVCHSKVAFSLNQCDRCHTEMHQRVPNNWREFVQKRSLRR